MTNKTYERQPMAGKVEMMRRFGEEYNLDQEMMDVIATYMDDEKREQVHSELAPCDPENFLTRYCELDLEFGDLLRSEFSIEL